jgi:Family of unknown function (DUF6275)
VSFTRHGHHISGTTLGTERPDEVARCGGERICGKCQRDAAKARQYPVDYEVKFDNLGGLISAAKKVYKMIDDDDPTYKARKLVFDYVKSDAVIALNHPTFGLDQVRIVWFNKTLQHWKAMVITTLPDAMFYEVTYNGDKEETYLDAYEKQDNVKFLDDAIGS